MNIKRIALAAALFAFGVQAAPHTHYIEAQVKDRDDRSLIARAGYAIDEIRDGKVFFMGSEADVAKLARLNIRATAHKMQARWFATPQDARAARYTSLAEVNSQLQALAAQNPALVQIKSLGKTRENRDTFVVRISSRTEAQAEQEQLPVVFYMGCHHAREHLSVEVPLLYAKFLVAESERNADIKRLLATREVYIAPVINPDGHAYDYTNGTRGRMWRKNRRNNGGGSFGVDLNRNYGYGWNTGGSSDDPDSDVYMGTEPFSEPETQNVRDFVNSQPRMTTLLSTHTFSELVLYPWGNSYDAIGENDGNAADLPVFEKMARDMAGWNHYTPQQSSDLYIASGDTTDWAYGTHGIFAFTFELSPSSMFGGGFYPSPNVIEPTFEANKKPLLYLLEFADNPHRTLTDPIPSFLQTPTRVGIGIASAQDVL
jgi:carboxypeptidase T